MGFKKVISQLSNHSYSYNKNVITICLADYFIELKGGLKK